MGAVADDDLAASRTAHRIVGPAAARGDPHDVRAVVGRRRHQHVVTVGDDDGVGMACEPAPQCALDVVDLTNPVELIAGQVQQHDHLRVHRVGDVRHVHLVDFEGRQVGVAGPGERGDEARVHVGALGVGGDGTARAERGGRHPGGRGLAVGAGHDDRGAARAELAEDRACPGSSRRGRRSSRLRPGRSPATTSVRRIRPQARFVHER